MRYSFCDRFFFLVLTFLLVNCGDFYLSAYSLAAPLQLAQNSPARPPALPESYIESRQRRAEALQMVEQALKDELAEFLNIHTHDVQIIQIEQQSWADSCLGLPESDEVCPQEPIAGWRILVSAGGRTWTYRADETGLVRREADSIDNLILLPPKVRDRILQRTARQFDLAMEQLHLVEAGLYDWDGCLGIPALEEGEPCALIGITGWRVVVTDGSQRWVYHTTYEGFGGLNQRDSQIHQPYPLAPTPLLTQDYPQGALAPGVVFQSITSGDIAGDQVKVMLYENGRIVSQSQHGQSEAQISQQQVEQFQQLLNDQQFNVFSGTDYPDPDDFADGNIVLLVSPNATARYAESVQDRLPSALQQVIQAWNRDIVQP